MPSRVSPAAVIVPVPAGLYVMPRGLAAAGAELARETPGVPATPGVIAAIGAAMAGALRCVLLALGGLGEMVVAAYAVPLAILVVGIPVVLLVRLVLSSVRVL